MTTNRATIDYQKAQLRSLYERHVSSGDKYALVDFPDHANVGDSAIWLGEVALLESITGLMPSYVCTASNFDAEELKAYCPNGVIFIHGGGNFGDIWPDHQRFREQLIAKFPDRQIVQLPQSIKFRDDTGIKRFRDLVLTHPNFTLYVRDEPSLQLAEAEFNCPTYLTPDSAFGIGSQKRQQTHCSVFMLLRTDSEKVGYDRSPLDVIEDVEIDDWLEEASSLIWVVRVRRRITKVYPAWDRGARRVNWFNWLANNRVKRGMAQLSRGRTVITDRLHGHILCVLLDIPHVALDNDYGKVSNYIKAWTSGYPNVLAAKSSEDAADIHRTLRS